MKKILILSVAIFLVASIANITARTLVSTSTEIRTDGALIQSPGVEYLGYANVWELHNINHHLLCCADPGLEKCKWKNPPSQFQTQPSNTDLEEYADNQISNNILSGSYNNIVIENDITYYRFLTWEHDALNNETHILIDVYLNFYDE